mgnify:CR=1 FL=1
MKVRKFLPLIAAALTAVLTLAIGAGAGSAKTDVQQAPAAAFKVTLVTDIGGLDDRSFNFLANKGLQDAKKKLGVQGNVFISRSDRDYIPNLTRAARDGSGLVVGVGFLMAEAVAKVAKRFPKTKFAIIDNSGVPAELKNGNPTNVRGLLFKEQEAGYLVGYLAARQITAKPVGGNITIGAIGGLQIPPVDRFIAGYYAGAKKANPKVKVVHSYSQDFVDQAKCKEQALNQIANGAGVVFQVAGQCGLGVLSAAKQKKVFGIGVDADQAPPRLDPLEQRLGVTSPAQRAIDGDVSRRWVKALENLVHHDRPMHARRRLAGIEHFLHIVRIPLRVAFLVFLVEPPRVSARITGSARFYLIHGPGIPIALESSSYARRRSRKPTNNLSQ